jgi:hypothetical protein
MKRSVAVGLVLVLGLLAGTAGWAQEAGAVPRLLDTLSVGEPIYYQNLTIIPLSSRKITDYTPYLTLDQALRQGLIEIREKGDGDVPWVLVSNKGPREIYIMAGEILSGCRQDRMVARDVLVAPKRRNLSVPVYCIEAGRWHSRSREFGSEKNLGTYKLRAVAQIAMALEAGAASGRASSGAGQGKIWSEVSKANRAAGVASDTDAFQDAYRDETVARKVSEVEEQLLAAPQLGEDTVGVVVALGEELISLDVFASPHLFRELWPKILKSAAMALLGSQEHGRYTQKQAAALLAELKSLRYDSRQAVDLGIELAFEGSKGSPTVAALMHREVVLHLAAFPTIAWDDSGVSVEEAQDLVPTRQNQSR